MMRVKRNEFGAAPEYKGGETGDHRENLPTSDIFQNEPEGPATFQQIQPLEEPEGSLEKDNVVRDPPVDCAVSNWSVWTECSVSCGVGFRERFRMVKVQAANGGKPCPRRLVRRKKCHKKCETES